MSDFVGARRAWPSAPEPYTLEIAQLIRRRFGHGGARFPGSDELYRAADLIESWQRDCEEDEKARRVCQ